MKISSNFSYLLKAFIFVLSILVMVEGLYIYLSLWQYEKNQFASEEKQLDIIIEEAGGVPDIIFDTVVNKPAVIRLMHLANSQDENQKNRSRQALYTLLKNEYALFTKHGVQQFHFHLPNNESFLRFHKPNKFGDNLSSVRASVSYTNKHKKFTYGFEEGRIFNGYRFVYPLIDKQGIHLGSVEISKSLHSFKKEYESADRHIDFLLSRKTVENKVFEDQLKNYSVSSLSNEFLIQKNMDDFNQSDPHEHVLSRDAIYERLGTEPTFLDEFNNTERFMQMEWFGLNPYVVKVLPLKNDFKETTVGHILIFTKSQYFEVYRYIHITLTIIIVFISLLITLALLSNRSKLQSQNYAEQIKSLNKKYVKTNKLLDSIINGTEDLIFYKDKDLNYLGCNQAFAAAMNKKVDEVMGLSDFDFFEESEAEQFRDDDRKVIAQLKATTLYESVELPSGEKVYFYTQKIPFAYSNNQDKGILGIARNITALHEAQEKLKSLSVTDELTELLNRKAYNQDIIKAFTAFNRYQTAFNLIMFDIDDFKNVNDTYGHDSGDKVLVAVANCMQRITRETDLVYRIGGEEFIVILPNITLNEAIQVAEKLRASIEKLTIKPVNKITASFGVTAAKIGSTPDSLFKEVDDHLYKAKACGKNQVISA